MKYLAFSIFGVGVSVIGILLFYVLYILISDGHWLFLGGVIFVYSFLYSVMYLDKKVWRNK